MTVAGSSDVAPFYTANSNEPAPRGEAPRLLLVSYHFPPDTAVGGLRWQQLARYVAERGWEMDVIMRDPGALPMRDDARLRALPAGVRVFGCAARKPRIATFVHLAWRLLRVFRPARAPRAVESLSREEIAQQRGSRTFVRAYFAWLDFASFRIWARSAARIGRRLTRSRRHIAVVTSGPPHMAHEAGRLIAERAHLPLILDFRDPWSLAERVPEHVASPVRFRLAAHYERRLVRHASLIAMNTDASRDMMRARYPSAAQRIIAVRNGSDPEVLPAGQHGHRFAIRFAGSIYLDRDPRLVFRAAARVVEALRLAPGDFGVDLIGNVSQFNGVPLETMAAEEGIGAFVTTGPPRPRAAAMQFLADAAMLLSLPQDSDMAIPAKIFEYVQFDAWLLILANERSATAQVLRGSSADVVDPSDVDGMARVIRCRYEQWRRGERPVAAGSDGRFDRRVQAEILLDAIERVASVRR